MIKRKTKIKGYIFGIEPIDQSFGGLKDGSLYCLCCTQPKDTSSLSAKVAIGLASRGKSVVIFTTTLTPRAMFNLLVDTIQQYDVSSTSHDFTQRKFDAINKFGQMAILIESPRSLRYESLTNSMQKISYLHRHAIECVIIDNMQNMITDFPVSSKAVALDANLYLLNMIAKEYKIPIVVTIDGNYSYVWERLNESSYIDKMLAVRCRFDKIDKAEAFSIPIVTIPPDEKQPELFETALDVVLGKGE